MPRKLTLIEGASDFVPGWYAVASSKELRGHGPLALERFGSRWVAFRHQDGVSVLLDRCPHRAVALSGGVVRGNRIVCPFHGFEFTSDGACAHIPAHGEGGHVPTALRTRALPTREAQGFIFVWWGPIVDPLPAIDWFHDELDGCFGPYESWADTNVGLSRNIENQLDYTHLPFVHRRTIGRFIASPKMEVDVEVEGGRIRAFQRGVPDQYVELRTPNLWINKIGSRTFVMLAFAPIDRERTRLYIRYYQGKLRIPLVRDLVGWVMSQSNKWIVGEDIRVIETHRARVSPGLDGSEVLIPSDAPIIAYRKLRHRLANSSEAPEDGNARATSGHAQR